MIYMFLLFWLSIIVVAICVGVRHGRKSGYKYGKVIGGWIGFFVTIGWYIALSGLIYIKEQSTVSKFCNSSPKIEIFITPEEYKNINKNNVEKYKYYRYYLMDYQNISYLGVLYKSTISGGGALGIYSHDIHKGAVTLTKSIFLDKNYQIVLFQQSSAFALKNSITRPWIWADSVDRCGLDKQTNKELTKLLNLYGIE